MIRVSVSYTHLDVYKRQEYITFEGVSPMADLRKQNGHEKPWKIDFFGVGNANWGCGGNMTPEYYANLYRRYQTYVRQYHQDAQIYKVCGGCLLYTARCVEETGGTQGRKGSGMVHAVQ